MIEEELVADESKTVLSDIDDVTMSTNDDQAPTLISGGYYIICNLDNEVKAMCKLIKFDSNDLNAAMYSSLNRNH